MRGSSPPNPEPPATPDNSTFFQDGRRKVDFVLVYEEASGRSSTLETSADKRSNIRQRFMANLRRAGLDMEEVHLFFKK